MDQGPEDVELRNIIDKLAQFVARNGPEFEQMTKTKQSGNPKFAFLFGGKYYQYYVDMVERERMSLCGSVIPSYRFNNEQYNVGMPIQNQWGGLGGHHNQNWQQLNRGDDFGSYPDIHCHSQVVQNSYSGDVNSTVVNIESLNEQLRDLQAQKHNQRQQVLESEANLDAQNSVTRHQVDITTNQILRHCKLEYIELLSTDTGINLDEIDSIMRPIIESCTKDSISAGKSWIFHKAVSHDTNKMIAHYMSYRVTDEDAPFTTKLHLVYLMNDVLHHCIRKNADSLKQSFESVAVEMFCAALMSASSDEQRNKLDKLTTLWENKRVFSPSTISKMRNSNDSWKFYQTQLREEYSAKIADAIKPFQITYDNYESQHKSFVNHANMIISSLDDQIFQVHRQIKMTENANSSIQQRRKQQQLPQMWPAEPIEPKGAMYDANNDGSIFTRRDPNMRNSRWDNNRSSVEQQNINWGSDPQYFGGPPVNPELPDMSRPPPGFPGAAEPPKFGFPPEPLMEAKPLMDEQSLIPTLPYYELPAGLTVPLIKMEDSGNKPLDPKLIRLPHPAPPSEKLIQALDMFYAPPSHDNPRDPDGWEVLGLYEWNKEKSEAMAKKKSDIDAGRRETSPVPNFDPYDHGASPIYNNAKKSTTLSSRRATKCRSRSRSLTPTKLNRSPTSPHLRRSVRRSRRSMNSESSGGSRSPSPGGGYSMPSYLTKRSPSPNCDVGGLGPGGVNSWRSSPTIDNKGHQILPKMGWIESNELGVSESASGSDVRDKLDQYKRVGISRPDEYDSFRRNMTGASYNRTMN